MMASDLASYTARVEQALRDELATYVDPSWLYDPVRYLMDGGGKRVRPVLTLLCCEAAGGNADDCMPAAVAVELLHNFTLVHDDIMDRSLMRRGRATVHTQFGESAAILSGDVLMGVSMRLLERSVRTATQHVHDRRIEGMDVIAAFSTGLIDVCDGQALDLAFMQRADVTIDEYFTMITKKTARLLEMSATIGARLAGADDTITEHLRTFAADLGIAFQLQDDLLDLVGTASFGKSTGGDIVEGKRTWLMLAARERTRNDASTWRMLVDDFFAQNGLDASRIPEVTTMLTDLGVIDDARALVEHYSNEAFAHLHAIPPSAARNLLEQLGTGLMSRVQ